MAYEFQMTREQIAELVANIIDNYELHLGVCQSATDALKATQAATIASFDDQAAKWMGIDNNDNQTKH